MRIGRVIKWSVLLLLLGLIGLIGGAYYLASRVPSNYHPAQLTAEERQEVAEGLFGADVSRFDRTVQSRTQSTYILTEKNANMHLAALDEIAALNQGVQPGTVHDALRSMGLSGPAVSFADDEVTFMVRSDEYNKVLSVDMSLEARDGMIHARITGARVGNLTLPDSVVEDVLRELGRSVSDSPPAAGRRASQTEQLSRVLPLLVDALVDGRPMPAEFEWAGRRKRIDSVTVRDGELTLSMHEAEG